MIPPTPAALVRDAYRKLSAQLQQANTPLTDLERQHVQHLEHSLLLAAFPAMAYATHYPTQSYVYLSGSTEQVLGYPADELWKRQIAGMLQLFHPDDLAALQPAMPKALRLLQQLAPPVRATASYSYTFRLRHRDGHFVTVLQQTLPLRFSAEGLLALDFGLLFDITQLAPQRIPTGTLRYLDAQGNPQLVALLDQPRAEVRLTPREREIVALLMDGQDSAQIAKALRLSKHTVMTHRKKILNKAGVSNTVELVHMALLNGWI